MPPARAGDAPCARSTSAAAASIRACTASAPSSADTSRIWSANATKSVSPLHPSATSSSDARSVMSWHSVLANARAVAGEHSPIVPHAAISSPKMRDVTASAPAGSEPECSARSYSSSLYSAPSAAP